MSHRGRKPSGKPGAAHLAALQKAHGAGDFKAAKSAALNYAKECHAHGNAAEEAAYHGMVQSEPPPSVHDAPKPKPSQPPPSRRAQLAKLAMSRKK